jgi:DNA-directed RNA polymerase specialized sigma24 family protein
MMRDLFDEPPSGYPASPGYKESTTSRDAARKIAPRVKTLREQVLVTLQAVWPLGLTADEVAAKMGKSILSVRPRLSELRLANEIVPTTARRPNDSGVDATVWAYNRRSTNG